MGILATSKAVLPHFRDRGCGTIVNISSMGGKITFPLGTLYHGTKFAVEGLSEALHFELSSIGVRVRIIEPGMVKTDFAGRSFDFNNDPDLAAYQPLIQSFLSTLGPLSEMASPPELVAQTILEAVTDPTDRLRYEVGADAVNLLAGRRATDDDRFLKVIKAQFCIA
jgi:short-subunit dehydrogenase